MKKILCLALSLCLLITSCGLITLPSQAEEPETGVNLIGYYNKTTGTVKTSDYDTSTAKDLNLTAERSGFTYSFVPMTPPLAATDKAANGTVAEGTWMISASKLTQTLKDFENPKSAAYGSWLSCADNKQYFYADNSAVVPSYLDGTLLFPPGRFFVRAVAGLQNGHTYQISVDHYGYGGASELYLGFSKTAHSVEVPTGSGKIAVARAAWNTATFTVENTATADNGMTYLQLYTGGANSVRIMNLSVVDLSKGITVTSNHAKWGAASADKSVVTEEEEEVTLTATPYGDAAFEGWYDGDSLVSKANPYTFTATGSVNYIAKFSSSNIIGTGETNYDSPTFEEFPVNTNLRIEPKTYDADAALSGDTPAANIPNTLNAFKNTAETYGQWLPQYINGQDLTYAYAEWNDSVLKVAANPVAASAVNTSAKCLQLGYHSRQYVRRVDGLTPGKTYKFSFKYYVGGANTGETVFEAAILDEASAFAMYMPTTSIVKFNANGDWATGEFIYQHPVNSESSSAFIKLNARNSGSPRNNYYIDDLSLTEMGSTSVVDEVVGFSGNAMRTTGSQALRFKFYVPDEFKTKIYNKEVSELGFLVQYKAILGGSELVLGGKYNYSGKEFGVNTGVGYNKNGTDIVFEERDGKTYYSAALLNIGAKGDGTVNYNYYSQALCVRPYIKLVDGTVLYGSVQESTVFDTMAYILNEANTEVLEADRIAVQALLEANTDLYNAYEGWKK